MNKIWIVTLYYMWESFIDGEHTMSPEAIFAFKTFDKAKAFVEADARQYEDEYGAFHWNNGKEYTAEKIEGEVCPHTLRKLSYFLDQTLLED